MLASFERVLASAELDGGRELRRPPQKLGDKVRLLESGPTRRY